MYLICIYEQDLALNNQKGFIFHKIQPMWYVEYIDFICGDT